MPSWDIKGLESFDIPTRGQFSSISVHCSGQYSVRVLWYTNSGTIFTNISTLLGAIFRASPLIYQLGDNFHQYQYTARANIQCESFDIPTRGQFSPISVHCSGQYSGRVLWYPNSGTIFTNISTLLGAIFRASPLISQLGDNFHQYQYTARGNIQGESFDIPTWGQFSPISVHCSGQYSVWVLWYLNSGTIFTNISTMLGAIFSASPLISQLGDNFHQYQYTARGNIQCESFDIPTRGQFSPISVQCSGQ